MPRALSGRWQRLQRALGGADLGDSSNQSSEQDASRLMAVVEKVCLSTAIEQALVSPKSTSFGWQAKGKLVSIPAPTEWPVQGRCMRLAVYAPWNTVTYSVYRLQLGRRLERAAASA